VGVEVGTDAHDNNPTACLFKLIFRTVAEKSWRHFHEVVISTGLTLSARAGIGVPNIACSHTPSTFHLIEVNENDSERQV
jgi:hypothetical protein